MTFDGKKSRAGKILLIFISTLQIYPPNKQFYSYQNEEKKKKQNGKKSKNKRESINRKRKWIIDREKKMRERQEWKENIESGERSEEKANNTKNVLAKWMANGKYEHRTAMKQ